ncbi:MAG: hypothetical protein J6Z11_09085 [Candidatus Riflebacteria bacterium]|nr:hypothetical protein [Candidatus Riflebacteria bacterium]
MQTLRVAVIEERVKFITVSGKSIKEIIKKAQKDYKAGSIQPTAVSMAEIAVYDSNGLCLEEHFIKD